MRRRRARVDAERVGVVCVNCMAVEAVAGSGFRGKFDVKNRFVGRERELPRRRRSGKLDRIGSWSNCMEWSGNECLATGQRGAAAFVKSAACYGCGDEHGLFSRQDGHD